MRAPDLVKRDFTATRPDATWVADFTYCSTWSGIVYVAFGCVNPDWPHRAHQIWPHPLAREMSAKPAHRKAEEGRW